METKTAVRGWVWFIPGRVSPDFWEVSYGYKAPKNVQHNCGPTMLFTFGGCLYL